MNQTLPSTTLVIFGASGDLSRRKLLPALSEICRSSDIRAHLNILGISRREITQSDVLPKNALALVKQFSLLQMDYSKAEEFKKLKASLKIQDSQQVIFYFAVPPDAVLPIVKHLGQAKLNSPKYKLLMEKPFGTNLDSAKRLISETNRYFSDSQVYRIDHFLAKEMAQNITVFLGSNAIFRDVWNNKFIEQIEVFAQESIGIEGRVGLWESTGALRDFLQSHLMQLTALTLMEPCPDVFDFSMVQSRRLAALKSLEIDGQAAAVKGQYSGYRQEVGNPRSKTETFAGLRLKSNSPKWQGVPIWLATGKRLSEKLTEIRIHFKKAQAAQANMLTLRIQPKEAIELELWVKKPGYDQELQKLPLDFSYHKHFEHLPDAYEQVIVDAVRSRANLFASSAEVIASWEVLQPILDSWDKLEPKSYKPGTPVKGILSIV